MLSRGDVREAVSVNDILEQRASGQPDYKVLTFLRGNGSEADSMTYAQLDRRARAIAMQVREQAQPGQAALLVYRPGLEYIAALFGCMYAGVYPAPVYPPRSTHHRLRLEAIIADANASIALTDQSSHEAVQRVAQELTRVTKWIITDLERPDPSGWNRQAFGSNDVAFLQYTSGSTSAPKGVMLTHGNLLSNLESIAQWLRLSAEDVSVFWLPPYHDMGLIGAILETIYVGAYTVLMSPASFLRRPGVWLKAISRYHSTISGSPNFGYDWCIQRISEEDIQKLDLHSWRAALIGAEAIRAETLDQFTTRFGPVGFDMSAFLPCYGLAEATLFVTGALGEKGALVADIDADALGQDRAAPVRKAAKTKRIVSSGRTGPGTRVMVVDPDSLNPLKECQVGEIWVSGPSVSPGYWRRTQESTTTFGAKTLDGNGLFLRTGDLGFLRNGELFVVGRRKEVMILCGRNYYPEDVESLAREAHPMLRNGAAAFAIEVDGRDESVIVLELDRTFKGNPAEVADAFRLRLSKQFEWQPYAVLLVRPHTIPRTSSGKIQRSACRDMYLNSTIDEVYKWRAPSAMVDSPSPSSTPACEWRDTPCWSADTSSLHPEQPGGLEALYATLRSAVAARLNLKPDEVDVHTPLPLLGIDSLSAATLSRDLEGLLRFPVPAELMFELQTISAIALHLSRQMESRRVPIVQSEAENLFPFAEPPSYQGGENFDLLQIMKHAQQMPFADRIQYCSGILSTFSDGFARLYRRRILSATDREVEVLDPFTDRPKKMIMFGSNSYLGLAAHPYVRSRIKQIIDLAGSGLGGAPLLSGYTKWHRELEERLSWLKATEDTLLYSTGYSANVGLLSAVCTGNSLVLCDEYSHASFQDGLAMAQVRRSLFGHNDVKTLARLLEQKRVKRQDTFVGVEGLYSMDGDLAPLDQILPLCERYGAILIVDDAHATGVMGATGRGSAEHFDLEGRVPIVMGTMSKSLAGCGGFISSSKPIVDYFRFISRPYVFSASMPPVLVANALAGLEVMEREPERLQTLRRNIGRVVTGLYELGLPVSQDHFSPILAIRTPETMDIRRAALMFHQLGIFINSIEFPAVPSNQQRFRVSIMATHTDQDIDRLVEAFEEVWHSYAPKLKSGPFQSS